MTIDEAVNYLQGIAITAVALQSRWLVEQMNSEEQERLREIDTDLTDLLDLLERIPSAE